MPPRVVWESVAIDKGVSQALPNQALPRDFWSDAKHIRFDDGRAARWDGYSNLGALSGPGTAVAPVLGAAVGNGTASLAQTATRIVNIPAASAANRILIVHVMWRRNTSTTVNSVQLTALGSITLATALNMTLLRTDTNGTNNACAVYYYVNPPVGDNVVLVNFSDGNAWSTVFAHWWTGVDQVNPFAGNSGNTGSDGGGAYPVTVASLTSTWSTTGVVVMGGFAANDTTAPVANVPSAGTMTTLASATGSTVLRGHLARLDGSFTAADGVAGRGIAWTMGVAGAAPTMQWARNHIILRPVDPRGHAVGTAGSEVPLKVFDFAISPTSRQALLITTRHIWRYSPSESVFYPVDAVDTATLNYTTGTVTLSEFEALGAGGADWTAAGVAPHDLIRRTAGGDQNYRVVKSKNSATSITNAPTWGAASGSGLAYQITRPLQQYTQTNRPWALGYLGTCYIGSLTTAMLQWNGAAAAFTLSVATTDPIPMAKSACIFANRWVGVHTNVGAGAEPRTVRYSEPGAPLDHRAANFIGIEESQEEGIAVAKLGEFCVVYMKDAIHLLYFIGGTFVFARRQIAANFGLLSSGGLEVLADRHLFVGTDNFYELTPEGLQAIGDDVVSTFFNQVDLSVDYTITSSINELTHEWLVSFQSTSSPTGFNDKLWIYNYKTRAWSFGDSNGYTAMGRAKLLAPTVLPINSITTPVNLYARPYDDPATAIKSNVTMVARAQADGANNKVEIIAHQLQLNSLLERQGIKLVPPQGVPQGQRLVHLRRVWLGFDSARTAGLVKVTVGARRTEDEDYTYLPPVYYNASGGSRGAIDIRVSGREFALRIETDGTTGDSDFALERVRMEGELGGYRR